MNKKMDFRSYYFSCEIAEKTRIRDRFLESSALSYMAFYSKLRRMNFSKLEREAVENITGKQFDW